MSHGQKQSSIKCKQNGWEEESSNCYYTCSNKADFAFCTHPQII